MKKEKGGFGVIPMIFVVAIFLLLIVIVAQFSSKIQLSGTLAGEISESSDQFQAHAAMAAIRSNDELMEKMRRYTVTRENGDYIRSKVSEALSGYRGSIFQIQNVSEGTENILEVRSQGEIHRYTKTYIASPSPHTFRIRLGVGGEVSR